MRIFFCGLAMLAVMACLASATPKSKAKPHGKAAPHSSKAPGHAIRRSVTRRSNSTASRGMSSRGRYVRGKASARGRRSAPRQAVQAAPSSDRYREIQEALAAKGYLKTAPSGGWDQDSMDAMRRFQEDQKLTATGKLNSLSLIALGLGPKDPEVKTPEPPRQ